ncbi:MAG TPA: hypothetical protein HPQ04_12355 [Rhodospirillaceae bacterium]|nr:hypothetical protein [Rhodospirillaceae bacterium]
MVKPKPDAILIKSAYAVMMFLAVSQGLMSPYGNWDMLCYLGSVISWQEASAATVHGQTLAAIKSALPAWLFDQHSQNPLSREARDFVQVLPMCQIKPLYNGAIWLFHAVTTASLPASSWSVSALSFAALAILLWRWPIRRVSPSVWLPAVILLTWAGDLPMASLARLSTPDCLCVTLSIAAIGFALSGRPFSWFALAGWLATLARPDAAVLIGAFCAYFAWSGRFGKLPSVCLLAALVASLWLVGRLAGSYGWEKMFVYTFFSRVPNLAEADLRLSADMYWQALSGGFALFIAAPRTIALLVLSALGLTGRFMRPAADGRTHRDLLMLTWGCLGLRFLIWPAWGEDRFYYGYFILILACSVELIGPYGQALWQRVQNHRQSIAE